MGLDEPVWSDIRGEIYRVDVAGTRINVVFTKKGALRSGEIHPNTQYDRMLVGKFEVTIREGDKDVVKVYSPGETIVIPPNTPHLFKSLTDTWMVEWFTGPFEAEYYEPYRKFVKEQFK